MSRTFVVGTAGHVDHGKSSLVRALTGVDPDRLLEEQQRQMTIDLGFAEMTTPAGNQVHLIDVPGHERFVRNMLAGAGGIDAALLTIAADDGPMPQTREHLAILDLLRIERGVIALSKADLVDDEWLGFVSESIRELLVETALHSAEIVPISSVTGAGLPDLVAALDRSLDQVQRTAPGLHPRLPIDRVFSMPGFGTIVTGTLLDAPLRVGDRVSILPHRLSSRVRGLQSFSESVEVAFPGSRVAVNVIGLETSDLHRGDVLSSPDALQPTMRVDAQVHLLRSSVRPLKHNDDVVVFAGSAEIPAKAALLETEIVDPGDDGWVQLRLARPLTARAGDRFILRRPSPPETIGGGTVLELDPPRHKRFQSAVVARLEQLAAGDPVDAILAWLGVQFVPESELRQQSDGEMLEQLERSGRIRFFEVNGLHIAAAASVFDEYSQRLLDLVDEHHARFPLDPGISREALRQELAVSRTVFEGLVTTHPNLEASEAIVRRTGFVILFSPDQQTIVDRYLATLTNGGFQPVTPEEAGIPTEITAAMISLEMIVSVGEGIVFRPEQIETARRILIDALAQTNTISLAEYRDQLGTSRKYTQALLEYFDRQRVTRRLGDRRVAIGSIQQREGD